MAKEVAGNKNWVIVYYQDQPNIPAALVGLKDGNFMGYIPLRDPADKNRDGKISFSEWAGSYFGMNRQIEAQRDEIMEIISKNTHLIRGVAGDNSDINIRKINSAESLGYIKAILRGGMAAELKGGVPNTGPCYTAAQNREEFNTMMKRAAGRAA